VFSFVPAAAFADEAPESSPVSRTAKSVRGASRKPAAASRVELRETAATAESLATQVEPVTVSVTVSDDEKGRASIQREKARSAARKRGEMQRRQPGEAVESPPKKARRRPVVPVLFDEQAPWNPRVETRAADIRNATGIKALERVMADAATAVDAADDTNEVPELFEEADEFSVRQPGVFVRQPVPDSELLPDPRDEPTDVESADQPTFTSPGQLKKLSAIQPYADYEPFTGTQDTPSDNQCPCPETEQCECPPEVRFHEAPFSSRTFSAYTQTWEASNLYHIPLYFEDAGLERYGHTRHPLIQPFFSVGLMGVQLIGLPYQMTIDPVAKRRYTLGWYRPGECVTPMYYQIPLNAEAFAVQAATVTGGYFVFPP
jgi:hypothetical protein